MAVAKMHSTKQTHIYYGSIVSMNLNFVHIQNTKGGHKSILSIFTFFSLFNTMTETKIERE